MRNHAERCEERRAAGADLPPKTRRNRGSPAGAAAAGGAAASGAGRAQAGLHLEAALRFHHER